MTMTPEYVMPVNPSLAASIEQDIHEKICDMRKDTKEARYLLLNKDAYLALCYELERQFFVRRPLDIDRYRGLHVVLYVESDTPVTVLQTPYHEILYQSAEGEQ